MAKRGLCIYTLHFPTPSEAIQTAENSLGRGAISFGSGAK